MDALKLLASLLLISASATPPAPVERAGEVSILAHGPGGVRIEGKSTEVSIAEEAAVLMFRVPLAPIDTGIGLRNRHLREALEVEKFPEATLSVRRGDLQFPAEGSAVERQVTAELRLHGQSRTVPVHYRAERAPGGAIRIEGSLQLDMRDFDIAPPSYLGVGMSPDVEVAVGLTVDGL
jgi:polyisoprenoid-binding protein YceI